MGSRKDRPLKMRFLAAIGSMALIGSLVYIVVSEWNYYVVAVLATAVFGLAAPSVLAGESVIEMIIGFFEIVVDGIMEVLAGIFEAISSIFN